MNEKVKGVLVGLLIGGLLSSTVAFAATTTKIDVSLESIKYMFDGVQKTSSDNAIIYKGQLYVPLKFVASASGKDFSYDGKNKTAWIGKKDGSFKYLSDLKYARVDAPYTSYVDFNQNYDRKKIEIAGNVYQKGINFNLSYLSGNKKQSIDYNLNGGYNKLTTLIGVDDLTRNSKSTVTYRFIGDGTELASIEDVKGGDNPRPVDVDVRGVLKLQIVVEHNIEGYDSTYAAVAEPKLF